MTEQKQDISAMSFEHSLEELENIVRSLETGQAPLEDSIGSYERGMKLKEHCEKKLRDAQAKIEKITVAADGSLTAQPLDSTEQ